MTTQQTPETLTELKLTDELKQRINEAYVPNDNPLIVSYVTESGDPATSYRGSAVALSDTQLAVWTRNPESGFVKAGERGANLLLMYREPNPDPKGRSQSVITFRGKGRTSSNEAERRAVYDLMPQRERDSDADYKGVATIVELDSVIGFFPGYRLQMKK